MDGRLNLKEKLLDPVPVDNDFYIPRAWKNRSDLMGMSWELKGDYKDTSKHVKAPKSEESYVRLLAPEESVNKVKEKFNFKKWILSSTSFFSCCIKETSESKSESTLQHDEFSYPPF